MSEEQTDKLNQENVNTDVENSEGSGDEANVEHEIVLIEEVSSTSKDENQPFSNAAAAQRRVLEKEARNTVVKENERIAQLEKNQSDLMLQLQQQQQQQQQQTVTKGPAPTLNDCDWDQNLHTEAMIKWANGNLPVINQVNAPDVNAAVSDAIAKYQNNLTTEQQNTVDNSKFDSHYKRASELKVKDYISAEESAMANLGDNLARAIQRDVPNSEKVLYHLGKNPEKAMLLKNLHAVNPTKATLELGVMSGQLQVRPKKEASAEPETRLTGGTGGASQKPYPDTQQGNQQKRRDQKFKGTSWA